MVSNLTVMDMFSEKVTLLFCLPCQYFFLILKSNFIRRSKQEFKQASIALFSEKWQGVFINAGAFIGINTVMTGHYFIIK